jgi:hypothetical protein
VAAGKSVTGAASLALSLAARAPPGATPRLDFGRLNVMVEAPAPPRETAL